MTALPAGRYVVADVGGTNARMARVAADGTLGQLRAYPAADFPDFAEALQRYLGDTGDDGCDGLSIAAAGPVVARRVQLTNLPWLIDAPLLETRIGGGPVRLFNDLEAVALAIPAFGEVDLDPVGPAPAGRLPEGRSARLAVNVGTGFGASLLVPVDGGGWRALPGEPGHVTLEPADPSALGLGTATPWRGLSVEDLLSGGGVLRAYGLVAGSAAVADGRRAGEAPGDAHEVFARAGDDPIAAATVLLVTRLLARVSANLVLASCAWGGLFLTGGVVAGLRGILDRGLFRRVFDENPKMGPELAKVPASIILHPHAALLGMARALGEAR